MINILIGLVLVLVGLLGYLVWVDNCRAEEQAYQELRKLYRKEMRKRVDSIR